MEDIINQYFNEVNRSPSHVQWIEKGEPWLKKAQIQNGAYHKETGKVNQDLICLIIRVKLELECHMNA